METAPSGRRRLLTRDGLESLLIADAVTPLQYAAGIRYRDLFEATERGIRSNLNRTISGAEDKRALSDIGQKTQAMKRLEAKVQAVKAGNGRPLTALRLVAGAGRTIHSIGKGGADRVLYREALCVALDVVASHFGMH